MEKLLEALFLTLVMGAVLGSCVYIKKKGSDNYKACLEKAQYVTECEAIEN